jgi:hypothetical protein
MSSHCVLACLDRQASLDEDALEVLAIKEAQMRARGTARAAVGGQVAAKRSTRTAGSRVQGAPLVEAGARSSGGARGSAKKRNRGRDGALACACSRAGLRTMVSRGSVRFSGSWMHLLVCVCML